MLSPSPHEQSISCCSEKRISCLYLRKYALSITPVLPNDQQEPQIAFVFLFRHYLFDIIYILFTKFSEFEGNGSWESPDPLREWRRRTVSSPTAPVEMRPDGALRRPNEGTERQWTADFRRVCAPPLESHDSRASLSVRLECDPPDGSLPADSDAAAGLSNEWICTSHRCLLDNNFSWFSHDTRHSHCEMILD